MLHAHPSPLCEVVCVKLQSHWSCDEPEKALLSVDLASFLVCACKFISHGSLFVHICLHVAYTNTIVFYLGKT